MCIVDSQSRIVIEGWGGGPLWEGLKGRSPCPPPHPNQNAKACWNTLSLGKTEGTPRKMGAGFS